MTLTTVRPWAGRRLHLVGIGGAGMSGYARVAAQLGAPVSGSDRADVARPCDALRALGVAVHVGHDAANVPAGDGVEVFHSTAIPADNPERVAARERGLADRRAPSCSRELSRLKRDDRRRRRARQDDDDLDGRPRAAGAAALEPGYLIGGALRTTGANADWGAGEWLVVEADESDRSMLALDVEVAVVTNVELDHHATYALAGRARARLRRVPRGRAAGGAVDRPDVVALARRRGAGRASTCPTRCSRPAARASPGAASTSRLPVPGAHNARNAAAALEAVRAGRAPTRRRPPRRWPTSPAPGAASSASGRRRRARWSSTTTPTTRPRSRRRSPPRGRSAPRRVVAVFQPHLFSRTAAAGARVRRARWRGPTSRPCSTSTRRASGPRTSRASAGCTIAEATADAARGGRVLWLPDFAAAERVLRAAPARGRPLPRARRRATWTTLGRRLVAAG